MQWKGQKKNDPCPPSQLHLDALSLPQTSNKTHTTLVVALEINLNFILSITIWHCFLISTNFLPVVTCYSCLGRISVYFSPFSVSQIFIGTGSTTIKINLNLSSFQNKIHFSLMLISLIISESTWWVNVEHLWFQKQWLGTTVLMDEQSHPR